MKLCFERFFEEFFNKDLVPGFWKKDLSIYSFYSGSGSFFNGAWVEKSRPIVTTKHQLNFWIKTNVVLYFLDIPNYQNFKARIKSGANYSPNVSYEKTFFPWEILAEKFFALAHKDGFFKWSNWYKDQSFWTCTREEKNALE